MSKINTYDVIIIGAGLSGLSLAEEISRRTDHRILILEKKRKFQNDKNWCFWNLPENKFTKYADHSWKKIIIKASLKFFHKTRFHLTYLQGHWRCKCLRNMFYLEKYLVSYWYSRLLKFSPPTIAKLMQRFFEIARRLPFCWRRFV